MELTAAILLGLASLTVARPSTLYDIGVNANDVQEGYPGYNIEGLYSWISPEGAEFFVKWIADKNGYRVLESNAIPVGLDGIAADGNQGAFETDEDKVNQILGSRIVPEMNQDDIGVLSSFIPSLTPLNNDLSDNTLDQDVFIPIIKDSIYLTYRPILFNEVIDADSESAVSLDDQEPETINSIINPASLESEIDVDQEAVFAAINNILEAESLEVHIDAEPDFFVSQEAFGEKIIISDIQNDVSQSVSEEELFPVIHNDVPTSISEGGVFGSKIEVVTNEISSEQ